MIFILGPCVIESRQTAYNIADNLKSITGKFGVDFIFKASFDKANRTSLDSFRGVGIKEGLDILAAIKKDFKVKVLSDVHCLSQVDRAAEVLDIIQIPAFLCRQTDLILKVSRTGKTVNVKKGQFLSPYDVKFIIDKIISCGNEKIMITERGTFFGYNNLVVDFRSFGIMKEFGYPVIFDATHSVQRPAAAGKESAGDREFVLPLVKAAVAFGVEGIFCEVHPEPEKALSDKATSIDFSGVEKIIESTLRIKEVR
jgi:2-dehydro-3-deoxyphosphooctonate aldolase (KDO 8-P synthase)